MGTFLQRGISGFRDHRDQPLPTCDLVAFLSDCHAVSRETGCPLIQAMEQPLGPHNFIATWFTTPTGEIAALRNLHFPMLGFAEATTMTSAGDLQFVDCHLLADAFTSLDTYRVLTQANLQQTITAAELAQLSMAEKKQVAYWKPTTIGQILFNCWD